MRFLSAGCLLAVATATQPLCGQFTVLDSSGAAADGTIVPPAVIDFAISEGLAAAEEEGVEVARYTAFKQGLYEDTGAFDTLNFGFEITGVNASDAAVLKMGAEMAQDVAVKEMNKQMHIFYEDNNTPQGDRIGNVTKVYFTTCGGTAEFETAQKSPLKAKGAIAGSSSIQGDCANKASDYFNNKTELYAKLKKSYEEQYQMTLEKMTVAIGGKDLRTVTQEEIAAMGSSCKITVDYTTEQMSVPQLEMVLAIDRHPDTIASLKLKLEGDSNSWGFSGEPENGKMKASGGAADHVYTPRTFDISGTLAESISNGARLGAKPNIADYLPSKRRRLAELGADAAMGFLPILAIPCFFCCIYQLLFGLCHYCCIGASKPSSSSEKKAWTSSPLLYLFIGTSLFMLIGMATGLSAESATETGMEGFSTTLFDVSEFMDHGSETIDKLILASDSIVKIVDASTGNCEAANSFKDIFNQEIENPLKAQPGEESFGESILSIRTLLDENNSIRNSVTISFILLPFFLGVLYVIMGVVSLRRPQNAKNFKAPSLCCAPLVWIFVAIMWIVGGVSVLTVTLLADVCVVDPVEMISSFMGTSLQGGEYLLACKGEPMEAVVTLTDMAAKFASMGDMDVEAMMKTQDGCGENSGLDYAALQTNLDTAGEQFLVIVDKLRCNFPNKQLTGVFYDSLCTDVISGFVQLFSGLTLLAVGLVGTWLVWKKTFMNSLADKSQTKVVPAGSDKKSEEVQIKPPAASAAPAAPAAAPAEP